MAIAALAVFFPASADWQFTKWNMTRDEVIAASNGTLHAVVPSEKLRFWDQDIGAEGTYTENSLDFVSRFYFNKAGQLKIVRLMPNDMSTCPLLQLYLAGKYGAPAGAGKSSPNTTVRAFDEFWLDQDNGNTVRYTDIIVLLDANRGVRLCFASYFPANSIDKDGKAHFD